jgi:hypothetical protein
MNSSRFRDGAKTYRLSVPQAVPQKLFWSITVYDAETRSQIATDQDQAALRSLVELKDVLRPERPISTSARTRRPATNAVGSRPFLARVGSSTCASTDRTDRRSTADGDRAISKRARRPDQVVAPSSELGTRPEGSG